MPSVKETVAEILEKNRGKRVSGSDMAGELGVSRNAVWKAVEALRRDGYRISSATNSGYMLENESDVLSEAGIRACLSPERKSMLIRVYDEVDSTNLAAKREEQAGPALYAANSQTKGRGRLGRSFYSPADTGLYMSLAFDAPGSVESTVTLTCAAAVAVSRAIETLTGRKPAIKWVNDVYLDGKKICGILTEGMFNAESMTVGRVIIGIGVNVTTEDFPDGINAASVGGVSRNALAAEITDGLMDMIEGKKGFIEDYRARSMVIGKDIIYTENGHRTAARAVGVDDKGGLTVEDEEGARRTLRSGEISLKVTGK